MLRADRILEPPGVVWEVAVTTATNVLYYQTLVAWWTRVDTSLRFLSALSSSSTVVLFLTQSCPRLLAISSVVAAIGNLLGLTIRVPDRVRALGVILAEYVTHANVFERMHTFGFTEEKLQQALAAFGETEQREAKDHPQPIGWLMAKCDAAVRRRIGAPAIAATGAAAPSRPALSP